MLDCFSRKIISPFGTALSTEHKGQATFRCVWKHRPESMGHGRGSLGPETGHPAQGGRGLRGPWERVSWVIVSSGHVHV